MKRTFILFALCPLLCMADPFHQPKRNFNGRIADLEPVFDWWRAAEAFLAKPKEWQQANPLPPRPMPAWVRITVVEVLPESRAVGWVVNARIEEQPGSNYTAKVFILNPPDAQYRRWLALTMQIEEGRAYSQHLSAVASSLRGKGDDLNQSGHRLNEVGQASGNRRLQDAAQARYRQAIQNSRQAASAQRNASLASANVEAAFEELRKMGLSNTYTLDVFALRNGRLQAGLPVYDLGRYEQKPRLGNPAIRNAPPPSRRVSPSHPDTRQ
jgi:hypothetical protein